MNAVTIDNFDIKVHERYAQDQENLDLSYIQEASSVPHHLEITGTSSIYSSKWEELFQLSQVNAPWASFSPPPRYSFQAKRFFSHKIIPSIDVSEENLNAEPDADQDDDGRNNLLQQIINLKSEKRELAHLVEEEKSTILDLLHSIKDLNRLLTHVNSRKIQYQKG